MVKLFSLKEAQNLLPFVSRLLRSGQRVREKLEWLIASNDVSIEVSNEDGFHLFVTENVAVNKEFHRLYFKFYSLLEKLNGLGVVVDDLDQGTVGFPFEGKDGVSYYSWQLGEDRIGHWHTADECFEERRPLDK